MTDTRQPMESGTPKKSANAFRTISEVADDLGLPQHVLRFWETKFTAVKPMKRGGGRRYYRPEDVQLLSTIRDLLHEDGFTIKGVQKLLREQGPKGLVEARQRQVPPPKMEGRPLAESMTGAPCAPMSVDAAKLPVQSKQRIVTAVAELKALKAMLAGA